MFRYQSFVPVLKTAMFISQSKAKLDEKISFAKINHCLDPEIKIMLTRGCLRTRILHSFLVHNLLNIEIEILFLILTDRAEILHACAKTRNFESL